MTEAEGMRESFEAYVRRTERYADDANFVLMNNGEYRSRLIECDWQRWQAAWTAATRRQREEDARVCEDDCFDYPTTDLVNPRTIAKAIAAAIRAASGEDK